METAKRFFRLISRCTACEKKRRTVRGNNSFSSVQYSQQGSEEKTVLLVMTYNIRNAVEGTKIEEIASDIQTANPDIVCVQEVDCGTRRSKKKDVLKKLSAILKMNYCYFPSIKLQGGTYGNGILSRFPLENCARTPLAVREHAGDEGRVLATASIAVNGKNLFVYNTHLTFEDQDTRLAQLDFLKSTVLAQPHAVLCGDFNVESFAEFDRIGTTAVNTEMTPFHTYIGTDTDFTSIDNIFVTDSVTVLSATLCDTSVSDHRPLLAKIEF